MREREERRRVLCDALTTRVLTYKELMEVGMRGYYLLISTPFDGNGRITTGEAYNPMEKLIEFNGKLMIQQLLQATRPQSI